MNHNHKIVICDDDAGIVEVIKIVLESDNYQVMTISNGKGVLKKITDYKPDLILLDLWMPGMDGKEVMKILRRDPATKKIPIIITSALNDAVTIAKEIGADDCLAKPFDITDLQSMVKKYLK